MELHLDDDGFVRAPAAACYRVLTDAAAWGAWWPATGVTAVGEDRVAVRGPGGLRCTVALHGWRHDQGFHLTIDGHVRGTGEVWLEPGWGGTVVHHLWHVEGSRRRLSALRRWVRLGLWGVKDELQGQVLTTEGER